MAEDKERTVLAVFDIEARGNCMIKNGINAIGWCVFDCDTIKVLEKDYVCLQELPDQKFEDRCLREFWLKTPKMRDILERIKSEAVPAEDAIKKVHEKLVEWDQKYSKVYIATDNPAFDMTFMSYYMSYFGYPPMFYKHLPGGGCGGYRTIHATNSYAAGVVARKHGVTNSFASKHEEICNILGITVSVEHDHMPHNDAEHIGEKYLKVQQKAVSPLDIDVKFRRLHIMIREATEKLHMANTFCAQNTYAMRAPEKDIMDTN